VTARRLRGKQARGEPITIESFVIDTITKGSHIKFARFVLLAVSEEAKT